MNMINIAGSIAGNIFAKICLGFGMMIPAICGLATVIGYFWLVAILKPFWLAAASVVVINILMIRDITKNRYPIWSDLSVIDLIVFDWVNACCLLTNYCSQQ